MIRRFLSRVIPSRLYLWLRFRLDKYFGMKGMDRAGILHYYWKNPGRENSPENYLPNEKNIERSKLLLQYIRKHLKQSDSILELGCNVGRNLEHLREAGFNRLSGVDINAQALEVLKKTFPELAKSGEFRCSSIEDFVRDGGEQKDLIFTSAVLEHLPRESEWVFEKLARRAKKYLLTLEIEDEKVDFHRIVGRPYGKIFASHGLECIDTGSQDRYTLRVFKKK